MYIVSVSCKPALTPPVPGLPQKPRPFRIHPSLHPLPLIDSAKTRVVQYRYDAWGKPLSKTGSMANTLGTYNPFRYRHYVYDEETGLYYLQSRYYAAQQHRFVNADTVLGCMGYLLTHNIFTDPVEFTLLSLLMFVLGGDTAYETIKRQPFLSSVYIA